MLIFFVCLLKSAIEKSYHEFLMSIILFSCRIPVWFLFIISISWSIFSISWDIVLLLFFSSWSMKSLALRACLKYWRYSHCIVSPLSVLPWEQFLFLSPVNLPYFLVSLHLHNVLLKTKHLGYYNMLTLETKFFSFLRVCFVACYDLVVQWLFSSLYSPGCVATEVFVPWTCRQLAFWEKFPWMPGTDWFCVGASPNA